MKLHSLSLGKSVVIRSMVLASALAVTVLSPLAQAGAQNIQQYKQTNLVSNVPGAAKVPDPNLVNAWGLSRSSTSPWWVADNASGLSTLYGGDGAIQSLVVTIPPSNPEDKVGNPTGTIFNGSAFDFLLAPNKPAIFLFVTEDGTVSGWNPGVQPTTAVIKVNEKGHAIFKGMTTAEVYTSAGNKTILYVADFHNGLVQVFDNAFHHLHVWEHRFHDGRIPRGYAPFNVQNIGGNIYVTFAKQDSDRVDEEHGAGKGFVDVFSPDGYLLQRLEHGPWLNAPWGLTMASSDFGLFSHDVLVGNFGSGEIDAYDPVTGKFIGKLLDATNNPIKIDGLWALSFGNGAAAGPANSLYFTAGPNDESNGLFGTLTAVQNVQGNDQ